MKLNVLMMGHTYIAIRKERKAATLPEIMKYIPSSTIVVGPHYACNDQICKRKIHRNLLYYLRKFSSAICPAWEHSSRPSPMEGPPLNFMGPTITTWHHPY